MPGRRYYDYDDDDEEYDDYEDERPVRRQRRRGGGFRHFGLFIGLLAFMVLTFAGYMYLSGRLEIQGASVEDAKKTVVKKAVTTLIEKEIKDQTGEKVDLEAVRQQMEPEDQKKVDELLDKYSDEEKVKEVISAFRESDGDFSEMKDTITDLVDEEDIEEMGRLYEKYGSSYGGGR